MVMQTLTARRTRQDSVLLFSATLGMAYAVSTGVELWHEPMDILKWLPLSIALCCGPAGIVGLYASLHRKDLLVRVMFYPIIAGMVVFVSMYFATLLNPDTNIPVFLAVLAIMTGVACLAEVGYRLAAIRAGDATRKEVLKFQRFMETCSQREEQYHEEGNP